MKLPFRYVVSVEHASNWLPRFLWKEYPELQKYKDTHWAFDLGAAPVAKILEKELRIPVVYGNISRLAVDLNRTQEQGLVFGPAAQSLTKADQLCLLKNYYEPYVHKLKKTLLEQQKKGPVRWISLHSFTPTWKSQHRRVDLGILDHFQEKPQRQFSLQLRSRLQSTLPHWRVLLNEPYRGHTDAAVHPINSHFSRRRQDVFGICLEMNQKHLTTASDRRHFAQSLSQVLRSLAP